MKTIVQDGNPVLRKKAKALPEKLFGSEDLKTLIQDMTEALDKEEDGVALAAPQIGVSYRLFIVRVDRTKPSLPKDLPLRGLEIEVYVNPEIMRRSRKKQESDEGCLSVRGFYGMTKRNERTTIRARREDGTRFERNASGLLAQIFQHEIDHLNGILFTDHATKLVKLERSNDQNA